MLAATGLLFLYFWFAEVGVEIATVDGKFYSGYEAVQMNRKITEEFEGDLTDEKAVSYTHLDVYKRQSLHHIQKYVGCVYPERREMLNAKWQENDIIG